MRNKKISILYILTFLIISGCTDFFASLDKHKDWEVNEAGNIILHTRPQDFSNSQSPDENTIFTILKNQNFYYYLIRDSLKLGYSEKVLIYLFNHDEALEAIGTNTGGYSMSERSTIYYTYLLASYVDVYNRNAYIGCHEMAHLLTHRSLGNNYTRMMNDGYAVAISGSFGRTYDEIEERVVARTINEWMQFHSNNNNILTPEQLLNEPERPDDVFCPNAGAFISYLWQNYDIENVNKLFNVSSDEIISLFPTQFGKTFDEISDDYMKYLEETYSNE
ncbi:MAG: hypothetical protein KGZ97_12730 [Bacteroidetes bacterium]|nr:hypothetical protein [Bacteroidota bacterium]